MPTNPTSPADTPWDAEPSGDGFHRVVNAKGVVLARKCVREEAAQIAAKPDLYEAVYGLLGLVEDGYPETDRNPHVIAARKALDRAEGR